MSDRVIERRLLIGDRRRGPGEFDPDMITELAGVAEFYGCDLGPMGEDAIRRILTAQYAWQVRHDDHERQHARLRERVDAWSSERAREKAQEALDGMMLSDSHSSDIDPGTGRP